MSDILAALGLVLVLEGALYALFPEFMKRMAAQAQLIPGDTLRRAVHSIKSGIWHDARKLEFPEQRKRGIRAIIESFKYSNRRIIKTYPKE